jgi:glutamate synthase (NADPH/NADH) small chain
LNLDQLPVTIKTIERSIIDHAVAAGALPAQPATYRSGKRVAVVGSGPAGLAAAQQLARSGHEVVVLEKDDRVGGLLRYGIPDFKLEKELIDRRIAQMTAEGVAFRTGVHCGVDVTGDELRAQYDAVVLAGGAMKPRDLGVPGRELRGVHFAMEFLTQQNRRVAGLAPTQSDGDDILASGKRVIVLGGGDTGSDCVGTSHRQGAASVTSLELMPRPPDERAERNPWPQWPLVYRTSSSHEEGGARDFAVMTKRLVGENGRVVALEAVRVELVDRKLVEVPGSEFSIPCDLVLLAMGFVGPVRQGLLEQLGVALDGRGNVAVRDGQTSVDGVFAAGDMARGQSLVVWAIAEGRQVAARVDAYLSRAAHAAASL